MPIILDLSPSSTVVASLELSSTVQVPSGNVTIPKILIVSPDGSEVTNDSVFDTSTRLLSYILDVSSRGIYSLQWSCRYDTHVFTELNLLPITYIDVRSQVISLLQIESFELSEQRFNQLYPGIMSYWLGLLSGCIDSYNELGMTYGILFDTAMAMAMSSFIRPYVSSSQSQTGEIAAVGTGPDKIEYHRRFTAISSSTDGQNCFDNIWNILNTIPGIAACNEEYLVSTSIFKTAGRRSALKRSLGISTSIQDYSIYGDCLLNHLFYGGFLNAEYE